MKFMHTCTLLFIFNELEMVKVATLHMHHLAPSCRAITLLGLLSMDPTLNSILLKAALRNILYGLLSMDC